MDFLIRFVQIHETFRKPEIEALAILAKVNVEFIFYSEHVGPSVDMLSVHISYTKRNLIHSYAESLLRHSAPR